MINRRQVLASVALSLPIILEGNTPRRADLAADFARLETLNGGRLGVAVLDLGSGEAVDYRGSERFPMCSTFKFLLAAAILQCVDAHHESLERGIEIPSKPLLFNSPLTEHHAQGSMTIGALCHAILTRSDNTAANLLLDVIGGPPALTQFCRTLGDPATRLDRTELSLNEGVDGDPRDTTTPLAMAGDLKAVLLGEVLSAPSRDQLTRWMESSLTGLDRLRAKLPTAWRVADKTGANGQHTSNDVAVLWPPGRLPLIVSCFITQCTGPEAKRANMIAEVGRLVSSIV